MPYLIWSLRRLLASMRDDEVSLIGFTVIVAKSSDPQRKICHEYQDEPKVKGVPNLEKGEYLTQASAFGKHTFAM